jgi:hypothetical protein
MKRAQAEKYGSVLRVVLPPEVPGQFLDAGGGPEGLVGILVRGENGLRLQPAPLPVHPALLLRAASHRLDFFPKAQHVRNAPVALRVGLSPPGQQLFQPPPGVGKPPGLRLVAGQELPGLPGRPTPEPVQLAIEGNSLQRLLDGFRQPVLGAQGDDLEQAAVQFLPRRLPLTHGGTRWRRFGGFCTRVSGKRKEAH